MLNKIVFLLICLFSISIAANELESLFFKNSMTNTSKIVEIDVQITNCQIEEFGFLQNPIEIEIEIEYNGVYLNDKGDLIAISKKSSEEIDREIRENAFEEAVKEAAEIDHIKKYGTEVEQIEAQNFRRFITGKSKKEEIIRTCFEIREDISKLTEPQIIKTDRNSTKGVVFSKIENKTDFLVVEIDGENSKITVQEMNNSSDSDKDFEPGSIVIQNWKAVGLIGSNQREIIKSDQIGQIIETENVQNYENEENTKLKDTIIALSKGNLNDTEKLFAKVSIQTLNSNPQIKQEIEKGLNRGFFGFDIISVVIAIAALGLCIMIVKIIKKPKKKK